MCVGPVDGGLAVNHSAKVSVLNEMEVVILEEYMNPTLTK